ncbi:AP endonuclease 2, partial [Phenoliferia sp. Uapishka_3]
MKVLTWNVVHRVHHRCLREIANAFLHAEWHQNASSVPPLQLDPAETKITRAQMDNLLACMPSYDSFFSFYRRVPLKGIHGTAIFTKKSTVVPIKAEEGIGSCLIPSTLEPAERIGGYPQSLDVDLAFHEMKDLDMEGRTTVCDLGMFVIINLYCPNETNDDRLVFKNYFNAMVDARVRSLIKAGREVIVVGDLLTLTVYASSQFHQNICHSPLDSAESEVRRKEQGLENFIDHPPRKWLNEFVGPNGPMIDITRRLHPARKQMYTCWNTKIDARPSNYGTRLDYLLITPGLLPWVRDADILPLVMGSDHCPAYVNFYDQIEIPGRGMVHIWDELNPGRSRDDLSPPEPPAFAAKNYDEFSGKQKLLPSFFGKRLEGELGETPSSSAPARTSGKRVIDNSVPSFTVSNLPVASGSSVEFEFSRQPTTTSAKRKSASAPPATKVGSSSAPSVKGKEKAPATGQQSIASFFKPPPKPKAIPKKKKKKDIAAPTSPTASPT